MLAVDSALIDFARQKADYYSGIIGSYRPEVADTPADALDSIMYDTVRTLI